MKSIEKNISGIKKNTLHYFKTKITNMATTDEHLNNDMIIIAGKKSKIHYDGFTWLVIQSAM